MCLLTEVAVVTLLVPLPPGGPGKVRGEQEGPGQGTGHSLGGERMFSLSLRLKDSELLDLRTGSVYTTFHSWETQVHVSAE